MPCYCFSSWCIECAMKRHYVSSYITETINTQSVKSQIESIASTEVNKSINNTLNNNTLMQQYKLDAANKAKDLYEDVTSSYRSRVNTRIQESESKVKESVDRSIDDNFTKQAIITKIQSDANKVVSDHVNQINLQNSLSMNQFKLKVDKIETLENEIKEIKENRFYDRLSNVAFGGLLGLLAVSAYSKK